jgi:cyclopropane-fatty-acyl-phospholipid synthase
VCTASLNIAELPVIWAATSFVAVTRRFPASAATMTRRDSERAFGNGFKVLDAPALVAANARLGQPWPDPCSPVDPSSEDTMYRGTVLKSRDGIPRPTPPPPGTDMLKEARTARRRFYPVTVAYTAYASAVLTVGLRENLRSAALACLSGASSWTLVEYLVHRYVLHGVFPDGPGWLRRLLHTLFDSSHGDHHARPWDGRHVNGAYASVPFALPLAATSLLAPFPSVPVFVATILLAYVFEEWIHYSVHFHRLPGRYFAYIRLHHHYHHSRRGRDTAFGLSSGVWDLPLRTRIPVRDRDALYQRPRRVSGTAAIPEL